MTAAMTMIDYQQENNDLLRQIIGLQNDIAAYKAKAEKLMQANADLDRKLLESIQECSRWKVECLDRRQRMIAAQKAETYRVPIVGVVR